MTTTLDIPSNCPSILWHYTNINALIDIIKERRFRATHFSFLNDATEIKFGSKIVFDIFMDVLSNSSVKEEFQPVVEIINYIQSSNNPTGYYIISLTEREDFTTQWQAYTPPVGGCAIGFKSSNLVKAFSGLENVFKEKDSEIVWWGKMPIVPLCKCIYTSDSQLAEIRNTVTKTAENLIKGLDISRAIDNGKNDFDNAYIDAHAWDFLAHCVGIKHACFEQEKEWRLVYIESDHKKIKFNEKQRPYIELEIGENICYSDIIAKIMISPRGNNSLTRKKLNFLINALGEKIDIIDSELPLR